MNAPACHRCDDFGVIASEDPPDIKLCTCPAAIDAAMPSQLARQEPPEFTFGAVKIDSEGMTYAGARIEDGGRAYRTLMAVLHGQEPNPDDRAPRFPSKDVVVQDLGLMVARLAHALALHSPNDHMLRSAAAILTRYGMQGGVDYKALPELPKIAWPVPDKTAFNTERRDDPHNMSNRANPLNQGRRRSDRNDE